MDARARIKQERENGKSIQEKIEACKNISAGALVKSGSHRLGNTIFDIVKEHNEEKQKK